MSAFQFAQIGVIRSPYKEKFAVPRQPGLVKHGGGELHLLPPYNQADAVRGLEAFSHLWVLFVFHQTMEGGWRPTVRPPRLGGNARMGVFATRSTFRPNPIGMSLVELKGVRCHKDQVILQLGSLDLVDGTPVVDIKPYLPFAEALPDASASYAQQAPQAEMTVSFTPETQAQLFALEKVTVRLSRTNSGCPRSSSRRWIWRERVEGLTCIARALRPKWRLSARCRKVFRSRKSTLRTPRFCIAEIAT